MGLGVIVGGEDSSHGVRIVVRVKVRVGVRISFQVRVRVKVCLSMRPAARRPVTTAHQNFVYGLPLVGVEVGVGVKVRVRVRVRVMVGKAQITSKRVEAQGQDKV